MEKSYTTNYFINLISNKFGKFIILPSHMFLGLKDNQINGYHAASKNVAVEAQPLQPVITKVDVEASREPDPDDRRYLS